MMLTRSRLAASVAGAVLLLSSTMAFAQAGNASAQFDADWTTTFPNHDGGLAGWLGDFRLQEQNVERAVNSGPKLMRSLVSLSDYRYRSLDASFLNALREGFAQIRQQGAKVIPRFAYVVPNSSFQGTGGEVAEDASLDRVIEHIGQLAPVLRENLDVIAWFEAGFIGAWGEWHGSMNGLDSNSSKDRVREALLANFPVERQILFRVPADVRRWSPQGREDLNADDGAESDPSAWKPARLAMDSARRIRSDARRTGMHNDCFMSGETDAGTYPTGDLRDFTRAWNRNGTFGGEMCNTWPQRSSCGAIQEEGPAYQVAYLNNSFQMPNFRSQWRQGGCEATAVAAIGPRIALESISHPTSTSGAMTVTVSIRNLGWSRIYNRRSLEVVLLGSGGNEVAAIPLGLSSLDWKSGSTSQTAEVTVPASVPSGQYRVALRSPDSSESLKRDQRYALRFANQDRNNQRWDSGTGAFVTGTSLQVNH